MTELRNKQLCVGMAWLMNREHFDERFSEDIPDYDSYTEEQKQQLFESKCDQWEPLLKKKRKALDDESNKLIDMILSGMSIEDIRAEIERSREIIDQFREGN